MLDFNNYELN